MAMFWEIDVEMVGGLVRQYIARENNCWLQLRPVLVPITTSDNFSGTKPPRVEPARHFPNVDRLTKDCADIGTEVEIEDWDDDRYPTVVLRLTAEGWLRVREAD
jgi:hypothetical protein